MHFHHAEDDSRISFWLRVREYAVPESMIETATARRHAGDWAGACAAAGFDVDFHLRSVARTHGRDLTARIRADLRHLAPDLLRWHMPRIAPDGLLRPGLTVALARYAPAGRDGGPEVHLVARTPPAWADGGQRIALALWDGVRGEAGIAPRDARRRSHPDRRYRLDLHRHAWDARRAPELRARAGADRPTASHGTPCAVDRWPEEAALVLRSEGRAGESGLVSVRLGPRQRLLLELTGTEQTPSLRIHPPSAPGDTASFPVLPDAATWTLPDLALLRTGSLTPGRLHPLVAAALAPDHARAEPARSGGRTGEPRYVDCRGARHRIGLVDGRLAALDHDPAEVRREELLAALSGTPLPCLHAIDTAHRRPDSLTGVRERLAHGDTAGALAVVENLLGPAAVLREGPLQDALRSATERRIAYGLFRAGLTDPYPSRVPPLPRKPRHRAGRR
ncbi:hypothetical protein [Streptomyces sp. NPDC047014]|uniref:hypothetical protein n=1 Tax=Streptomyces sp. NPDC047014 TaxID=3155736 RepID=UPI00340955D6